jgi:hypothetical protein
MVEPSEQRVTAAGATWVWLRDGTAVPEPDALERLLEQLGRLAGLPEPVLLTSKVVDAGGTLVPALAPWVRRDDAALTLEAAGRGLLPLRAARTASLLVRAEVLTRVAPRRADLPRPAAGLEWTARILRTAPGYLVPASVAVAARPPRGAVGALDGDPLLDLRAGSRLLAGRAFSAREKLWLGAEVTSRAAGAGRRALRAPGRRGSQG